MPNATDIYANLIRADYLDWAQRYKPIEDELMGLYNNPSVRNAAQSQAVETFTQGFDNARAATDDRLAGYGIQLTPEQQASRDRSENLARGAGTVEAINRTGRRIDDRDQALLGGASGARATWQGAAR